MKVQRLINKLHDPPPDAVMRDVTPSNINFKLRQLALLSALAETGTLRRAAERIHVSQSGASRLLQELEEMLGVALFTRVKGKMRVTAAGEVMTAHAISLQNRMLSAYADTQQAARGRAGTLRLGVFGSVDPELLARSLGALREQLPGLQITINDAPQQFLLGGLRRSELDAAIGRLVSGEADASVRYDVIYTETFSVVCGLRNPLARRRRRIAPDELLDAQWILPPPHSLLRQKLETYFLLGFGRAPVAAIESLSLVSYLSRLSFSDDIGVMAGSVANFFARSGQLRILIESLGNIESPVALITRADTPALPATDAMLRIMRMLRPAGAG